MKILGLGVMAFILVFVPGVKAATESRVKIDSSGSNSSIKLYNSVNSSGTSTVTSTGNTSVHISQSGEGTSTVTINGKEYKQVGPGEINVEEGTSNTSSTPSPTLTVQVPNPEVLVAQEKVKVESRIDKIRKAVQEFLAKIRNLF